ncbi:hypothetical protein PENTCL1PPCAC_29355, partial [Pristionchus entomophagus]
PPEAWSRFRGRVPSRYDRSGLEINDASTGRVGDTEGGKLSLDALLQIRLLGLLLFSDLASLFVSAPHGEAISPSYPWTLDRRSQARPTCERLTFSGGSLRRA